MQIFIVSKNPIKAAQMLCDKHVVKMIVESSQILSTCHHIYNSKYKNKVYKKTHEKHPCVIWVCKSKSNYNWLVEHLKELYNEYFFRYNKDEHKSQEIFKYIKKAPSSLKDIGLTKFVQAIPEEFKSKTPIMGYRKYYIANKTSFCKWTKRQKPNWINNKIYF